MKNIDDVELFVFDLDGTVYIGDNEIDGSFNAVDQLRKLGKRVCFFTNNKITIINIILAIILLFLELE